MTQLFRLLEILVAVLLVTHPAFAALVIWISGWLAKRLTRPS